MCHISRENGITTPGGMKTISFQQVRSAPKSRPIVQKNDVILRAPLRHPAIECQKSAMNLINPVSRARLKGWGAGFVRSWKTWKSHGILKLQFPGLEKFWKTNKPRTFWKSHGNLFYKSLCNTIVFIQVLNFGTGLRMGYIAYLYSFPQLSTLKWWIFTHLFNSP